MRKVVVTGLGVCVHKNRSPHDLFMFLKDGQSLIRYDENLDSLGVGGIASCAVDLSDIASLDIIYPHLQGQAVCTSGKMAYHAMSSCLEQAGINLESAGERAGLFFGVNKVLITPEHLYSMWQRYDTKTGLLKPLYGHHDYPYFNDRPDHIVEILAHDFRLYGPAFVFSDACAAGTSTIVSGYRRVRDGSLDIAVCGAADEGSQPLCQLAFNKLGAINVGRFSNAEQVCRPFDRDRCGVVLADGSAFLLLEEKEHARSRGVDILAEISGGSRCSEAYKMTASDADGRLYAESMIAALENANLLTEQISHINAHGTSTRSNDSSEGRAIGRVFGQNIPVTSTKSALGHSLSGSGAIEAVLSVLSLQHQCLLPTLNFSQVAGDEITLNIVRETAPSQLDHILSNSFGFGGQNSSVIISRVVV